MRSAASWTRVRDWLTAVVMAAAILLVGWEIWMHSADGPIWPWAETNQGALTFAALVAAILFALIEQRRANSEAARRRRDYVAVVVQVADTYLADLRPLATAVAVSAPQLTAWNQRRSLKRKTLDLLRQTCPLDHRLVLTVTALDQTFECPFHMTAGNVQLPAEGPLPRLKLHLEAVASARNSVASLA